MGVELQKYKKRCEEMFLGGLQFDKVKMEASPFLRTMQTCSQVCKGLEQNEFEINYMFSEYLKTRVLSNRNPVPELISA